MYILESVIELHDSLDGWVEGWVEVVGKPH